MARFEYSAAQRCLRCDHRAVVPSRADAELLVRSSGGRLGILRCPVGNGWHLHYPAVEQRDRA